jgi:hypothetical protein
VIRRWSGGSGERAFALGTYLMSARFVSAFLVPAGSPFSGFGTPPHGGLGAGLNRIVMVLLGLDSIRESTFLFRGPNRLAP